MASRWSACFARALALALLVAPASACDCRCGQQPTAAPGPAARDDSTGTSGEKPKGSNPIASGAQAGGIRWIGRLDASHPDAVRFAWSAAGLAAVVRGARISLRLETEGETDSAFFQPIIDGHRGPRFQVRAGPPQTVVLADALTPGDHTIELYRESEGMFGDSMFLGFVEGTVKGAPPASGRLIELIGDSISAGYGNLGDEVHPPWDNSCSFSLETESAYDSYGFILARALNAEPSIIARSGWGMLRDLSGSTAGVLPSVYGNTLGTQVAPPWTFERKPDAVVINLGSNDSAKGDPGAPFEDAYLAFLRTVRTHYPDAPIFLSIGPMLNEPLLGSMRAHLARIAARAHDENLTTVDIPIQDTTSTGCDYHPNVAEDRIMAGILATAIRKRLGW